MKQIHLKNIKKDQIFYEDFGYGAPAIKVIALEDAYESGKMEGKYTQWKCSSKQIGLTEGIGDDQVIDYLVTENHEHYGAKLYVEEPVIIDPDDKTPRYLLTKLESHSESSKTSDIFEGYWVRGILLNEPKVGERLAIIREYNSKNPDGKYGLFNTSEITILDESNPDVTILVTRNSKYQLEKIK